MPTNPTSAELTVTQADRDAAADLIAWHNAAASDWITHGGNDLRFFAKDMPDGIRKGIWDGHDVVQAFARHRIEATRSSPEAEELARGITDEWRVRVQIALWNVLVADGVSPTSELVRRLREEAEAGLLDALVGKEANL